MCLFIVFFDFMFNLRGVAAVPCVSFWQYLDQFSPGLLIHLAKEPASGFGQFWGMDCV